MFVFCRCGRLERGEGRFHIGRSLPVPVVGHPILWLLVGLFAIEGRRQHDAGAEDLVLRRLRHPADVSARFGPLVPQHQLGRGQFGRGRGRVGFIFSQVISLSLSLSLSLSGQKRQVGRCDVILGRSIGSPASIIWIWRLNTRPY